MVPLSQDVPLHFLFPNEPTGCSDSAHVPAHPPTPTPCRSTSVPAFPASPQRRCLGHTFVFPPKVCLMFNLENVGKGWLASGSPEPTRYLVWLTHPCRWVDS